MREARTTIHGNLAKDPARYTNDDGSITASFRIGVNSRYFDSEKRTWIERPSEFYAVYARRSLARHVLASLRKGDPVVVTGRLGTSEWTREDGSQGHNFTIQAESVGHDLKFGSTVFTRSPRREDAPNIDENTGEVLGSVPDTADEMLASVAAAEIDAAEQQSEDAASVPF